METIHDEVLAKGRPVSAAACRLPGRVNHHVVIFRVPASGLAPDLGLGVRVAMHVRGVEPYEERTAGPHASPLKRLLNEWTELGPQGLKSRFLSSPQFRRLLKQGPIVASNVAM